MFEALTEKLEDVFKKLKRRGRLDEENIASALKEEGIELDKNSIILEEPIKSLGIHELPVKLHAEVDAKVKIWIVKK